jgi:hypothetical protein
VHTIEPDPGPRNRAAPAPTRLLGELLAAHRTARLPELVGALQACGLSIDTGPVWGVSFVEIDAHHYAPVEGGKPAVIVSAFEEGRLLDLVAVGLETRSSRTRMGIATVLGQEWIDHAKDTETTVRLFPDPITWLLNGRRGAVVVDWRAARYALADVPGIACESELLAKQVDRVMRQPVRLPPLFVREVDHAAA